MTGTREHEGRGEKEGNENALNLFLFWVSLPTELGPVTRAEASRDNLSNRSSQLIFDTKTPKELLYMQQRH